MASLLEAGVGCESQIADINVLPEWDSVGREETVAEPQGATQDSVPKLTRGREMLQMLEGPQRSREPEI